MVKNEEVVGIEFLVIYQEVFSIELLKASFESLLQFRYKLQYRFYKYHYS